MEIKRSDIELTISNISNNIASEVDKIILNILFAPSLCGLVPNISSSNWLDNYEENKEIIINLYTK